MHLDVLEECVLCREGEEDYKHLFFQCPSAHKLWASQGHLRDKFLGLTTPRCGYRREKEGKYWQSLGQYGYIRMK